MDADNNLEDVGVADFLEMASVGSTSLVNIVVQFDRAGPTLLCAYSKSVISPTSDDGTLAQAQLPVDVGGGGSTGGAGGTGGGGGLGTTSPRPANTKKPHVTRSGRKLT